MIFSRKNAGKWVAVKNDKIIATNTDLAPLYKKMNNRIDKDLIGYSYVPREQYFAGGNGIRVS